MPFYNFTCTKCGDEQELILRIEERDNEHACEVCDGSLERHKGRDTPNQNTLRSANRDRMKLVKEQIETRQQMYNLPPEERMDHQKHIDRLAKARQNESQVSDNEDFHKADKGIDITK